MCNKLCRGVCVSTQCPVDVVLLTSSFGNGFCSLSDYTLSAKMKCVCVCVVCVCVKKCVRRDKVHFTNFAVHRRAWPMSQGHEYRKFAITAPHIMRHITKSYRI